MKKFRIYQNVDDVAKSRQASSYLVEADFIYAQPSGVSTLHRFRTVAAGSNKSDIVAVVPANLLILEV